MIGLLFNAMNNLLDFFVVKTIWLADDLGIGSGN
jgi:hypothetical protein